MKHISHRFMYIRPMYLRLTTFTKTLPQMSFHLYFFAIFISLWGSTHDSADCRSAHRPKLPAAASNMCTADVRLGGNGRVAPKQKSWLRRCGGQQEPNVTCVISKSRDYVIPVIADGKLSRREQTAKRLPKLLATKEYQREICDEAVKSWRANQHGPIPIITDPHAHLFLSYDVNVSHAMHLF